MTENTISNANAQDVSTTDGASPSLVETPGKVIEGAEGNAELAADIVTGKTAVAGMPDNAGAISRTGTPSLESLSLELEVITARLQFIEELLANNFPMFAQSFIIGKTEDAS